MTYNLTFLDNGTGILSVVTGINDLSSGLFSIMLVLSIWVLLFVVFQAFDTIEVIIGSSFVVSLLTGFMAGAGLLAWAYMGVPIAVLVGGLIFKLWD